MDFSPASLVVLGVASTPVTADMLVVLVIILLALVPFAAERFPVDVTAILVL